MHRLLIFAAFFISSLLQAQTFEIGLGGGTGTFYIFEEGDGNVDNSFTSASTFFADAKYILADQKNGLKLRMQMTSTQIAGEDYQTRNFTNGYIDAITTSLLYERLNTEREMALGYFLGAGHTVQTFDRLASSTYTIPDNRYMSITAGGVLQYTSPSGIGLWLEPSIQWADPINSLRDSSDWQTGGEDVNFMVQVGVSYRIPLNQQIIEEEEIIEIIEEE